MTSFHQDHDILLFYEDLINVFNKWDMPKTVEGPGATGAVLKRLARVRERIELERRLIEDISRPGRLLVEHFSMFLENMDYSVGFATDNIKAGRGILNHVKIGEWGTITLAVGSASITWRDADVGYMFYPDRIIVRPRESAQDDITIDFSYSFKYDKEQLKSFSDVAEHEQTLYWHKGLLE